MRVSVLLGAKDTDGAAVSGLGDWPRGFGI